LPVAPSAHEYPYVRGVRHDLTFLCPNGAVVLAFPCSARPCSVGSRSELRRLSAALETETDWRWRSFRPLCLLFAPRRGELLTAQWDHVDLEQRVWFMPTTKNKGAMHCRYQTPRSPSSRRCRARVNRPDCFPASRGRHLREVKTAWKRLCVGRRDRLSAARPETDLGHVYGQRR
jgi:integrase